MQSARFTTTLEEISSVVELGGRLQQKNEGSVPVWSHFVGILSNVGSLLPLPAAPDSRKAVSHHFDYYSDSDSDSDCSDEDFGLEFQTCGSESFNESRDCSDNNEFQVETKEIQEISDAKRGVEDVVEEKTPLGFNRVVSADRALCILPSIVEVDEEEDEVLSPISLGKFENDIENDAECEFDSRKKRRRQWRCEIAGEESPTNELLIEELKEELRLAQQLIQRLQAQVGSKSELVAESCVDMKNGPIQGDTEHGTVRRPDSTTTCASFDQSTPPSIAKERGDEQQQDKIILTRTFGASRLMVKLTLRCNEVASAFSIIHKASYRDDASWTHWNVSMSLPLQEYIKCCCKSTGDEMMSSVLLFVRENADFAAALEDFDGVFSWTCHYPSSLPPSPEERSLKSRQSDDGSNMLPVRSSSFFSLDLEPQVPSKDRFVMITEDLEALITPYGGENASKRHKEDVLRLLPLSLASEISHWRLCQQKQFKRLLLRVHQACKEVAAEHDKASYCTMTDPLSGCGTVTAPCIRMEERTVDFHWQPASLNDVCSSDSDNSDNSDLTVNESKPTSGRVNAETSEYSVTPEGDTKQENATRERNVSETVDGPQIDYEQLYRQSYDEDLAFQGRLESLHACLGEQLSLIHCRFLHELTCSQF